MSSFELVQVHECGSYAEVTIRDKNGKKVYAGHLPKVNNPGDYYSGHTGCPHGFKTGEGYRCTFCDPL